MMKELLKKADELLAKVRRLLEKQEKMTVELSSKQEKLNQLAGQLKEKNERIKKLELEIASLRTASGEAQSSDQSNETRMHLNDLIRELDKCIAKISSES